MAEGKKSFVLYCDYIHTVEHLTDEQAGILFKHILRYVNDLNPETEDIITNIAFTPIKQQLKRDLKEWEQERRNRSESGRIGGLRSAEARRSKVKQSQAPLQNLKQSQANEAVTVNVTDTVTVNVTERENTVTHTDVWQKEAERKRPLNECMGVAMRDEAWINQNKTNQSELEVFNEYLIGTGEHLKTILDYKKHFHHLKRKYPEKLKKKIKIEDYHKLAKEYDEWLQKQTA